MCGEIICTYYVYSCRSYLFEKSQGAFLKNVFGQRRHIYGSYYGQREDGPTLHCKETKMEGRK